MKITKEKQITINSTEEAKEEFKALKEQYDLTDKDMVHILIDTFKATDATTVATVIADFAEKKKTMQIEAKLARYARKIQMLRESMVQTQTPAENEGEVVYSAESEEVDA